MRTWIIFLLASVLALTLCSCVSESQDKQSSGGTKNSSQPSKSNPEVNPSSPTPTPTYKSASAKGPAINVPVPKLPTNAAKNSEKGAAEFVDYYFDLVNYVGETYDTKPIKRVTTRQCEICGVAIIDPADRGKELKAWQVGGKHHHELIDAHKPTSKRAAVTVRYWVDSSIGYKKPNIEDQRLKAIPKEELIIELIFSDQWKVDKISGAS